MADFNFYLNRQGVRGQQGEQGPQGFSPIITVATNTLSEYVLQIQTQNNTFLTANLREHKEDLGGTYIRYNRETGVMYAGAPDMGGIGQYGMVSFASATDIQEDDESTVVSPANVNDMIDARDYDGSLSGLDSRLTSAEGRIRDNAADIASLEYDVTAIQGNYATINTPQTISGMKTFTNGLRTLTVRDTSGQAYLHFNPSALGSELRLYATTTTTYGDLVVAGTSSVSRNGNSYTVVDSGNISGYLPAVPTKTSDLTNDSGFITSSDLPTVGNGTITFTQGGVTKGTITTNQSGDSTIALDAGGGSNLTAGNGIDITNDTISVVPDGATIGFNSDGELRVISAPVPNNMVTTDTTQTITASKTFSGSQYSFSGYLTFNRDGTAIQINSSIPGPNQTFNNGMTANGASYDGTTFSQRNIFSMVNSTNSSYALSSYIKLGDENVNTQIVGAVVTDGNGNAYLTSANISTNVYIQALEARIAALEANINGGNA